MSYFVYQAVFGFKSKLCDSIKTTQKKVLFWGPAHYYVTCSVTDITCAQCPVALFWDRGT